MPFNPPKSPQLVRAFRKSVRDTPPLAVFGFVKDVGTTARNCLPKNVVRRSLVTVPENRFPDGAVFFFAFS